MPNLLIGKEVHWWFRSRQSGRLNSLSFWLFVLLISVLLSTGFSTIWEVQVAEQSRLKRASEYSDWIYSPLPNALKALSNLSKGSFLYKRTDLINRVQYGDQAQNKDQAPLIDAESIKSGTTQPAGSPGSMFGKPDIRVYPSCATYSKKNKSITPVEEDIFRNFAAYASAAFNSQTGRDDTHIERSLANALGLSEVGGTTASFNVPWIYVASKEGAISVFPGTTVIAEPRWQITSRPWFMAAFGGDSQLVSKGLDERDLLSVTYLDVLAKSPMLVRTYMYKFSIEREEFVVAIDLNLRDEESPSVTTLPLNPNMGNSTPLVSALLPKQFRSTHVVVFLLSVFFFGLLRWISAARNTKLTFKLSQSLLGKIKVDEALTVQKEEQTTKDSRLGLDVGKYAYAKTEKSESERKTLIGRTNVEKLRSNLRGLEEWEVNQSVSTSWRLLWISFETTKRVYVGTLRLLYKNEILPEAKWIYINRGAFSESEALNLEAKLPTILQRNADLCQGYLEINFPIADVPALLRAPSVPEWVRAVVDARELLAVRQRRAYVRLSSAQLDELYSRADVKAVVLSSYLEQLLEHGQIDFWLKGKTISRLISFPDKASTVELAERSQDALRDLLERYSGSSSRSLKRVDMPISGESTLLPVYDFAVLNDAAVIVTHSLSKATVIDSASGKQIRSTYYVEGYLSWRPADIEFYRGLFEELAEQSRELKLRASTTS